MNAFVIFAAEEAGNAGLFQALGLDVKQLAINTVAFLILLMILAKFVYPALIKSIDSRRATIEASLAEAKKSQEASEEAEQRVEALLTEARKEADEIIARSHSESQTMIAEAETKAKSRAEKIVADARVQLTAEIDKARESLKKETLTLVALATEKVVGQKVDAKADARIIEEVIAQETPAANAAKGRRA
jgi:F-type H+-transporting ATPase subunit b